MPEDMIPPNQQGLSRPGQHCSPHLRETSVQNPSSSLPDDEASRLNDEILNESDDVEYSDEEFDLEESELDELDDLEGLDDEDSSEDLSEEFDELAREPLQLASTRSPELYANSLANAVIAAKIADDLRGQDIVVLDMTHLTSIVDFFVIVTGNSRRQMHAIADEVNRKLKHEDGNRRFSIEGYRTEGNWILTDYGDVVLHVFTSEGRLLYNLEQLWADAKRIDWKGLLGSGAVNAGAMNTGTSGKEAANTGTENAEPG